MSAIRLEDLGHVYPSGVRALQGIDLAITTGEAVAIIGANGCGKTTLLRHLPGLLRPTAGRVLIDGRDTARERVARLAGLVGLAFQDPDDQLFARDVRSEVAFGPRSRGWARPDIDAAVVRALERTALVADARRHPGDLGATRRRLLAIASVLAMETPVVALDEPTTGLDARGRERVGAIVAGLAGEGRTVVATSHDMRFVAESFDRVVVMAAGRIVLDGSPAEVFAKRTWSTLAAASIEPPYAARVGARLGLGPTPTAAALLSALAAGSQP